MGGEHGVDLSGSGAEPLAPDDPRQIGSFPLVGRLGSGGMGRVYLGVASGRYTAVKQVLPILAEDQDFLRHFGHELDNLGRLPTGVSASLLATDRTARPPWFATEYVPGLTLDAAVELHGGSLPREALWRLLGDAASALGAVHAREIVHRDLKPSNVMLTLDGLTLIDFGIARAADQSRLTQTGMVIGTLAYMAPEQAAGSVRLTGAADVFSLGCLVVYAATGRPPFGEGAGHAQLYRIVHEEPDLEPVRRVDADLADLLEACLAKNPAARPAASDLAGLAREKAPAGSAEWPSAVAERLSERAAFAAKVPDLAEFTRATVNLRPAAGPEVGVVQDAPAPKKPRERRPRVLLAVVPAVVVVSGTVIGVSLMPYGSDTRGADRPATGASSPAAHSAGQSGGAASAQPNRSGTPSSPAPSASSGPSGAASSGPGASGSSGTTAAPPGSGPRPGGAAGGSGSGAGGSGSGGGTPAGGGTRTNRPPADPPAQTGGSTIGSPGTYRVKNVSNSQCLSAGGTSASYGPCESTASYAWTFKYASDGSFQLINRGSGYCLVGGSDFGGGGGFTGYATTFPCGQTAGGQHWRIGTRTSSGSTIKNTSSGDCLEVGSNGAMVTPCDSTQHAQLWVSGGAAS
ncbi:protein kinase [Streptomyces melanogenes]|uniref:protein kinase domain-containing protein n=1 Tax=Streptomyces melanogenes TaxID=67326 RepID=UPI0037B2D93D